MDISKLVWITAEEKRVPLNALSTKHMYNILKLYKNKHKTFTPTVRAIESIYNYRKKIITINHVANCNTVCGKVAVHNYKFPWV